MPIPTLATLATTPYQTSLGLAAALLNDPTVAPAPANTPTECRAEHVIYSPADCRITYAEAAHAMNPAMRTIAGAGPVGGGDTLYLPFFNDKISSIRLTWPPPGGVAFFFTDNLSGCKVFVDDVPGTNDIIVYHANTTNHSAGSLGYADFQPPNAGVVLDGLHTRAMNNEYAALHLAPNTSVAMPRYFRAPADEERRKAQQSRGATAFDATPRVQPGGGAAQARTRPMFMGGVTVLGLPGGGKWDLYFQTWGDVGYARPGYARLFFTGDWKGIHKRRTLGGEHRAAYANMRVMELFQFF
jgi:hypothetical protein